MEAEMGLEVKVKVKMEVEREAEKLQAEKLEVEKVEVEKMEAERLGVEKLEVEKLEAGKAEVENVEVKEQAEDQELHNRALYCTSALQLRTHGMADKKISCRNKSSSAQAEPQHWTWPLNSQKKLVPASIVPEDMNKLTTW
jgi:hypothetical protein